MLIRRYQAEDNEAVKKLHYAGLAQFGAVEDPYYDSDLDDIEKVYLHNNGDFLVGIEGSEIVAMGAVKRVTATRGEIKRIRVRQDRQQQGYGEEILLKLIGIAAGRGYGELCLDTVTGNTPAERLFRKCGFIETHRGKVGAYDLIYYAKKLKEGGK